jgi:hypothetical protein
VVAADQVAAVTALDFLAAAAVDRVDRVVLTVPHDSLDRR